MKKDGTCRKNQFGGSAILWTLMKTRKSLINTKWEGKQKMEKRPFKKGDQFGSRWTRKSNKGNAILGILQHNAKDHQNQEEGGSKPFRCLWAAEGEALAAGGG